jgi:hypothetical protein
MISPRNDERSGRAPDRTEEPGRKHLDDRRSGVTTSEDSRPSDSVVEVQTRSRLVVQGKNVRLVTEENESA